MTSNLMRINPDFSAMMAPKGKVIATIQVNESNALIGYNGRQPAYYEQSSFTPSGPQQILNAVSAHIVSLSEQIDVLQQWLARTNQ